MDNKFKKEYNKLLSNKIMSYYGLHRTFFTMKFIDRFTFEFLKPYNYLSDGFNRDCIVYDSFLIAKNLFDNSKTYNGFVRQYRGNNFFIIDNDDLYMSSDVVKILIGLFFQCLDRLNNNISIKKDISVINSDINSDIKFFKDKITYHKRCISYYNSLIDSYELEVSNGRE